MKLWKRVNLRICLEKGKKKCINVYTCGQMKSIVKIKEYIGEKI